MAKKVLKMNLRHDQSYSYKRFEYVGKFEETLDVGQCENCGRVISRLYYVEGSLDKKEYMLGSECVKTLTTLLNPSDYAEAQRQMAHRIKFIKWVRESCTYIMLETYKHRGENHSSWYLFETEYEPTMDYFHEKRWTAADSEENQKLFDTHFKGKYITKESISQKYLNRAYEGAIENNGGEFIKSEKDNFSNYDWDYYSDKSINIRTLDGKSHKIKKQWLKSECYEGRWMHEAWHFAVKFIQAYNVINKIGE